MENPSFYFWIGLALGAVIGVAAAFLYWKIRGVFSSSEVSRLRQENRTLKQRLEKKDKHIQEMMHHTEKIASGLAEHANKKNSSG
jgi:Flp pilus assembly protein TadB